MADEATDLSGGTSRGLNLDMTDADRLTKWADNLDEHGADVAYWADRAWLADEMRRLSRAIDAEVRDVGVLRAQLAEAEQRARVAEHELALIVPHTARGVTDCSTPLPQRVSNIVEQLATAERERDEALGLLRDYVQLPRGLVIEQRLELLYHGRTIGGSS